MKCRHCGAPWEQDGWEYCPECKRNFGGAVYPATQTDQELRDAEELITRIRRAFADVTLGDGWTIHEAHLEGIYGREDARVIATRAKDPETNWVDVPDWKIEQGSSTLSFLDVEGWRFYLPAFLCWSLKNWRTTDSITADSLVWSLRLNASFADVCLERFTSLDRAQAEAIYEFLAFFDRYSGEDDARSAMESYWIRFGSG